MTLARRRFLHLAAAAATLPAFSRIACAQSYPTRPVTIVVAFGAGGLSDVIARILADGMRAPLGHPVVIENVAGASGTIGVGRVARAAPDGYTAVLGNWATHVLNGPMFTLPYDLIGDFEPVALVSSDPLMIVGKKALPANNLKEFVAWLKANPDQATQGTTGAGGISTVGGLFFQRQSGTKFRFVPYRIGLAAAMQDLVAGQIDFMIDTAANSLPQVRAGTIKAFAVTSKPRLAAALDIPTVDEAGLPGLYALNWQAVFLPKNAPKDVVEKLNSAIATALADPSVQKRLAGIGQAVFPPDQQTPEALASFQKAEVAKWWPLIKAANIKAE
ncbi:MAG: tripartite tricarboxylate transporter substrate binding protein BugD [Rhizobiales bacterium]|nr:tripartite tricarboxylate transporter substrate binding protein BugD [Hyphomicrobiales bacterium]